MQKLLTAAWDFFFSLNTKLTWWYNIVASPAKQNKWWVFLQFEQNEHLRANGHLETKVVVTLYLRLRNEFQPFPAKQPGLADPAGQPIKGLGFGRKWLEFISQSQIKSDYNFSSTIQNSSNSNIFCLCSCWDQNKYIKEKDLFKVSCKNLCRKFSRKSNWNTTSTEFCASFKRNKRLIIYLCLKPYDEFNKLRSLKKFRNKKGFF